ncbi:MAG TPA: DUF2304 domain-containing protein [Aggregatilineales bacterium]|nr:DUF2304 domain-containing protein [Aggregatilineales bacterium]
MFTRLTRPELIMLVVPVALLLYVLEMVRRRRIREDYALLWLVTLGALFVLSFFRDTLLERVSDAMGIAYPPAALFVIGFGLMLLVMLQFSVIITRLTEQSRRAAQQIALLNARIAELERHTGAPPPDADGRQGEPLAERRSEP